MTAMPKKQRFSRRINGCRIPKITTIIFCTTNDAIFLEKAKLDKNHREDHV